MSAYVIADIHVKDAVAYESYKRSVEPTVTKFGGRFLARGGATVVFEGEWKPSRVILLEFPDQAALEAWYRSPDYAPLLSQRLDAANGSLISVVGS